MEALVREVHARNAAAAGLRFVLSVAGGGSSGIAALLSQPGSSATLLAADVPYARAATLAAVAPAVPHRFASAEAAVALAASALRRAKALAEAGAVAADASRRPEPWAAAVRVVGVGVAAALASEPL